MAWTTNDYPDSWKNLSPEVRKKAIEIGNALLRDHDYEEERVIAIATSQAEKTMSDGEKTEYEVKTHDDGWQLIKKDGRKAVRTAGTKEELLKEAQTMLDETSASITVYKQDGSVERKLYE